MRNRNKQIVIRMSEDEYNTIKSKVAESGLTQQEYLIAALSEKEIIHRELGDLNPLIYEMKRQGANLNQIAKILNERGFVDYGSLAKLFEEVAKTWQSLRQFLQKQA